MIFFLLIITLEILIFFSFKIFKKKFVWLISNEDEVPNYDFKALKKFYNTSFDNKLGWVRKPNTSGYEKGKNDKIKYNIDEYGSRKSIYDPKNAKIVSIGDSYVFCRQVSDENTWQNKLSKKIDSSILNYGVGNYGIDQAILRMDNIFIPKESEYMILGFVPETILRIQSYWKHYLEFGNTFAFKPKFELKGNNLYLIDQYIDNFNKYKNLKKNIRFIRKNDRFYKEKFLKYSFSFPYIFSFFKNLKFNLSVYFLFLKNFFNPIKNFDNKLYSIVMKHNLIFSQKFYSEKKSIQLLDKIIQLFYTKCKEKKIKPILLIIPQMHDLISTNLNHLNYFNELNKKNNNVIDLTKFFKTKKIKDLYIEDSYGGHLSEYGNRIVADKINIYLNNGKF